MWIFLSHCSVCLCVSVCISGHLSVSKLRKCIIWDSRTVFRGASPLNHLPGTFSVLNLTVFVCKISQQCLFASAAGQVNEALPSSHVPSPLAGHFLHQLHSPLHVLFFFTGRWTKDTSWVNNLQQWRWWAQQLELSDLLMVQSMLLIGEYCIGGD